jgi:hypothetical protein
MILGGGDKKEEDQQTPFEIPTNTAATKISARMPRQKPRKGEKL